MHNKLLHQPIKTIIFELGKYLADEISEQFHAVK